jgi:hypothetical protein
MTRGVQCSTRVVSRKLQYYDGTIIINIYNNKIVFLIFIETTTLARMHICDYNMLFLVCDGCIALKNKIHMMIFDKYY